MANIFNAFLSEIYDMSFILGRIAAAGFIIGIVILLAELVIYQRKKRRHQ